ncbi:MAG TPA: ACP S-malonyltransferase, partial [Acidimicrobiia bacterium]
MRKVEASMPFAVLFPGQGSQFVGMGADLFDARADLLVDTAEGVLGWSLRDLCLGGPEDELTRTERAQPALFALAYALWEELEERISGLPSGAAGHSVGEYTAHAAAGTFTYADGLRLVAARGEGMAAAADRQPSGMAALLGVQAEEVQRVVAARASEGGRLWIANLNAPGQVVVAGGARDLQWLTDRGREHGIRRVVPLKVAGAFHSPLMEPAVGPLRTALSAVSFSEPRFAVWGNSSAAPVGKDQVPEELARQIVSPVRFADSLAAMASSGVNVFVHVGPGDVTAG